MASFAFDIYATTAPNGARLVRLTPSKAVSLAFRLPEIGFGMNDGQIVIHSAHADATAANFAKHNLVKVVAVEDDLTETKVGGFFLEEGDFTALSTDEQGGRLLKFSGPNTLQYLERAILREVGYTTASIPWPTRRGGIDVKGMWTWGQDADGREPGPIMVRVLEEGRDQPGAPLGHATWDFTRSVDSAGTSWDALGDEWQVPWGTTALDMAILFIRSGEFFFRWTADLEYSAYKVDPGITRTSSTFASGKVLFKAGENIVTEVHRGIDAAQDVSSVLVTGGEYETAFVTGGTSSVPWIRHVNAEEASVAARLTKIGQRELDARATRVDAAFPLTHIVSDDELNGGYIPFIHYAPGDIITIHTGTDAHDFNNFAINVAAVRIVHDEAGNWFGMPELGAQTVEFGSRSFEERSNRLLQRPNPELCRPGGTPGLHASGIEVAASSELDITLGTAITGVTGRSLYALVYVSHHTGSPGVASLTYAADGNQSGSGAFKQSFVLVEKNALTAKNPGFAELWKLDDPAAGTTAANVRLSNVAGDSPWAVFYADSATVRDFAFAASNTTPGTLASVTVDSASGDRVLNLGGWIETNASPVDVPTAGGGQTLLATATDNQSFGQPDFGAGIGHQVATGSTTTPTWTISTARDWYALAISLTGAGGDGSAEIVGTSVRASRCDHNHYHNDLLQRSLVGAHPAAAVEVTPSGTITDTNAQGVFEQLDRVAANVAEIADPGTATAEDAANTLNSIISALVTAGLMAGPSAAFPVLAGSSTGNRTTDSTTQTIDLPASIAAGDLLIALVATDGNPTFSWPAGWTALHAGAATSNAARIEARYRVADGTEGASISITTSASEMLAYHVLRLTGAGTPEASTGVTGTSTAPDPDSLSPSFGSAQTLWIAVWAWDQGQRWTTAYPSGYTNGAYNRSDSTGGCGVGRATLEGAAASENPGAATLSSNEEWRAFTIAVPPA